MKKQIKKAFSKFEDHKLNKKQCAKIKGGEETPPPPIIIEEEIIN